LKHFSTFELHKNGCGAPPFLIGKSYYFFGLINKHQLSKETTSNNNLVAFKTPFNAIQVLAKFAVLALLKNIWLLLKSQSNNEVLRDLIIPVISF
jgi:hypothetical protein